MKVLKSVLEGIDRGEIQSLNFPLFYANKWIFLILNRNRKQLLGVPSSYTLKNTRLLLGFFLFSFFNNTYSCLLKEEIITLLLMGYLKNSSAYSQDVYHARANDIAERLLSVNGKYNPNCEMNRGVLEEKIIKLGKFDSFDANDYPRRRIKVSKTWWPPRVSLMREIS